jgi:hypothetical protein
MKRVVMGETLMRYLHAAVGEAEKITTIVEMRQYQQGGFEGKEGVAYLEGRRSTS